MEIAHPKPETTAEMMGLKSRSKIQVAGDQRLVKNRPTSRSLQAAGEPAS
jgi:hypothetical protein